MVPICLRARTHTPWCDRWAELAAAEAARLAAAEARRIRRAWARRRKRWKLNKDQERYKVVKRERRALNWLTAAARRRGRIGAGRYSYELKLVRDQVCYSKSPYGLHAYTRARLRAYVRVCLQTCLHIHACVLMCTHV